MGLKKAYDKLTDNPEFSNGLAVSTGQAIEDGDGTERLPIDSFGTEVQDENGSKFIGSYSGVSTNLFANSDRPIRIEDNEGDFTAVEYSTSASAPGTLELSNANLDMSGQDITNANSVSAGETTITEIDSSIETFRTILLANASGNLEERANDVTSVSTSATDIWSNNGKMGFAFVFGENGTERFIDLVGMSNNNDAIQTVLIDEVPDSRTYNADFGTLELTMSENTYDVVTMGVGAYP